MLKCLDLTLDATYIHLVYFIIYSVAVNHVKSQNSQETL